MLQNRLSDNVGLCQVFFERTPPCTRIRIEAAVIERKLKDNAEDPLDPQNIRDTQKTLIHAEVSKVNVSPTALQEAGKKFLDAAMEDPSNRDAWNAVIAFVNYKSFLNTSLFLKFKDVIPVGSGIVTHYSLWSPPGTTSPQITVAGSVPKAEAAELFRIGQPNPDALADFGNDWIIAQNGGVTLDNMRLRKVVIVDDYVYYNGGPVQMKDVYFIGGTFNVPPTPNGKRFVEAFLDPSPSLTFEAD